MPKDSVTILTLYDAHGPMIGPLAEAVSSGVSRVEGAYCRLRTLADARKDDLLEADGLVLGSPNWTGVTGDLKRWLDDQGDFWEDGSLRGKVAAAFTTGRGRHSGLEFTLLSLIHWMLAGGMVVVGLPWSEEMKLSGSYYGATATGQVTDVDLAQAAALGERVAHTAMKLSR